MSARSKIEWTDATWNPITGCSPVSVGCDNCYARRMAQRLKGRFGYRENGSFQVTFHPDRLVQPFKWKKARKIFVCSMGDIFHDDVQVDWIDLIFGIIEHCRQHTFIILTKRPENIKKKLAEFYHNARRKFFNNHMPDNVWIGVTVEHPDYLWRIEELLPIPATVRFVSVEPMLENVDMFKWLFTRLNTGDGRHDVKKLNWVICGAETGQKARPINLDWARDLRNQCKVAGVPFFFKSAGGRDTPDDLEIREFPKL